MKRFCIGPAPSAESYLVIDNIVDACRSRPAPRRCIPATASSRRTRRLPSGCEKEGIASSAPASTRSRTWATKSPRRQLARKAGVNTIPGYRGRRSETPRRPSRVARDVGYPVMLKASAGGGGKGMRHRPQRRRMPRRLRAGHERGPRQLRRRTRLHRKIHRAAAAHRDSSARRPARKRHPPGRARMLAPAPAPEGHRGVALAVSRRSDARRDGEAGRRAGAGRQLLVGRHRRVHRRRRRATSTSSR